MKINKSVLYFIFLFFRKMYLIIVNISTVIFLFTFIQTNPINLNELNETKETLNLQSGDYHLDAEESMHSKGQGQMDASIQEETDNEEDQEDDRQEDQEEKEYNMFDESSFNDQELYEKILKSDANIPIVNINFSELNSLNRN
jgi:hypothetical protein